MNDLDAKTFNDIATVLKKSILEWFGPGAYLDTSQNPQVRSFAHSFIARYIVSGSESQALLVKIAHKANQSDLQGVAFGGVHMRQHNSRQGGGGGNLAGGFEERAGRSSVGC